MTLAMAVTLAAQSSLGFVRKAEIVRKAECGGGQVTDTGRMWNTSRGLRETVIRAMAKVCLVWAVAVLGALFVATSAQAQHDDGYSLSSASADAQSAAVSVTSSDAPRTAGLALALIVLGGGVTVLAIGSSRHDRVIVKHRYAAEPDPASNPASDLPLALGLGLLA
jgi:hypothetical protein